MRISHLLQHSAAALLSLSPLLSAASSLTGSRQLSSSFKPPQVFENVNLVRNVNLDKSYPRETVNIVIKNTAKTPQSEYWYLFPTAEVSRVGGFEVKNKKRPEDGFFTVDLHQYEEPHSDSYYLIQLPEPLAPGDQATLSISYVLTSATHPLPKVIEQQDRQTITYTLSAYLPSAYNSLKQKTKLTLPTSPADYTRLTKNAEGNVDPLPAGKVLTYGLYNDIAPHTQKPVTVRYEYTKPLLHATLLERDIEVSHWGGNLATEERYWLTNRAAKLKNHFSRVQWQMTQYASPPTTAAKELRLPLQGGSLNPYFIDDIGNVSTSRWNPGRRESILALKPRYPVFGGWNYSFKVGWDADVKTFLKKDGDRHFLRVPFLEGPKPAEGVEYEKVVLRVILPEGATNVQFFTPLPIANHDITTHKTFMDTLGRPTITLTALNVVDEWRDKGELLVSYEYAWTAGYRKPITITLALFGVFFTTYVVSNLNVSIGKKR